MSLQKKAAFLNEIKEAANQLDEHYASALLSGNDTAAQEFKSTADYLTEVVMSKVANMPAEKFEGLGEEDDDKLGLDYDDTEGQPEDENNLDTVADTW